MLNDVSAIANLPLGASIDVFTDGACLDNPGPAAWALVVTHEGKAIYSASAALGPGTNNVAELSAAIEALRVLQSRPDLVAAIRSDSNYVVKGITAWVKAWKRNKWRGADKKPVKNRPLWETLDSLASTLPNLDWRWVPGHSGNEFNEMADSLAGEAARGAA